MNLKCGSGARGKEIPLTSRAILVLMRRFGMGNLGEENVQRKGTPLQNLSCCSKVDYYHFTQ